MMGRFYAALFLLMFSCVFTIMRLLIFGK